MTLTAPSGPGGGTEDEVGPNAGVCAALQIPGPPGVAPPDGLVIQSRDPLAVGELALCWRRERPAWFILVW